MRFRSFVFITLSALALFLGCSQRKDFEPKEIAGSVVFNHFLRSDLNWTSRTGAMLKNGDVITQNGKTFLKLHEHSKIINETKDYYIIAKECQAIELIDKNTQEARNFPISTCLVSANIKHNFLAFILRDNTYGILDINKNEVVYSDRGAPILAVDSLLASPVFLDTNVVFPTLDGQLAVVSLNVMKTQRVVIVHSERFFSNVIYLQALDGKLIAATTKRLIVLVDGKTFAYEGDIRDVKLYNNRVYVLTLEGKIIELDLTMRILNEVELPFALLSGIVIAGDKLFSMERLGYLIELDLRDFTYKTYTLQSILGRVLGNGIVFYDDRRIYYDQYYLDFSKDLKR